MLDADCAFVSRLCPSATGHCRGCLHRHRVLSRSPAHLQLRVHAHVAVRDEPAWTPRSVSAAGDSNRSRCARAHARSQHFCARPSVRSPTSLRPASMVAACQAFARKVLHLFKWACWSVACLLVAAGRAERFLRMAEEPPNHQMRCSDAPRSCGGAPPVCCTRVALRYSHAHGSVVASGGPVGAQ